MARELTRRHFMPPPWFAEEISVDGNYTSAIPTKAAREMVKPESLEDVLEALKRDGFIRGFEVGRVWVWVAEAEDRHFELAVYISDLNPSKPIYLKTRKPK